MEQSLFTFEKLWQAHLACRKRKRGTMDALRFESRLLDNLHNLLDELRCGSYHPSSALCFVQRKPKLREIFASAYRDRVVQHLLVGHLEPRFERRFIHDSYACRRGKGTHAALGRLRDFLRRATGSGSRRAWFLKEDIAGFFMNIDRELLLEMILLKEGSRQARWLAEVLVRHDCTKDYRFKGNPGILSRIPPHKTLFKVPPGKGLPIGNLTSQFFANVYLDALDQFIKRKLGVTWYIRYCDDFVLLGASPEELMEQRGAVQEFLRHRLQLDLNSRQHRLRPVSDGIDFLGYIARPTHVLVRRRVVNQCRQRLDSFEKRMAVRKGGKQEIVAWQFPPQDADALRATLASYLGHFTWADAYRLTMSLFHRFPVLRACFCFQAGKVRPRYVPPGNVHGLRLNHAWFWPNGRHCDHAGLPDASFPLWSAEGREIPVLLFFQAGSFYEFYDQQAEMARDLLGLRTRTGFRGRRLGAGFHGRWLGKYLQLALSSGKHVTLVRQCPGLEGGKRWRMVRLVRGYAPGDAGDHGSGAVTTMCRPDVQYEKRSVRG